MSNKPYLYSKGMRREGLLYNQRVLQDETDVPCFVVEGTLDALALWPGAVAVLGKPIPSHLETLMASRRPIAVCLDGDAWVDGEALALKLRFCGVRAVNIKLPAGLDPDEMPAGALMEQAFRKLALI